MEKHDIKGTMWRRCIRMNYRTYKKALRRAIGLRERIKKELTSPRAVERRIPHENERVLLNEPDTPR
ncbi:unnamed protein product, partial [Onchocerca ochengi]|uniref:Transposase n=1 Tax=Onchocerca ochengi TaxID=42157 RepID=A0A182EMZ5_ONCOC